MIACSDEPESDDNDVIVRTQTEEEWRKYVAIVVFAAADQPTCWRDDTSPRRRIIVTGFGRFLENK